MYLNIYYIASRIKLWNEIEYLLNKVCRNKYLRKTKETLSTTFHKRYQYESIT
jgi:hypothetical protein